MISSSSGTAPSNSAERISATSCTDIMSPVFTISGRTRLTIKRSGSVRCDEFAHDPVRIANGAHFRRRHDDRFFAHPRSTCGSRARCPRDNRRSRKSCVSASSSTILTIASSETASFSRVWAAGSIESDSKRLSLINACRSWQRPFDDLHEIEHDALLHTEHEIEVAQTDIRIDQHDLVTALWRAPRRRWPSWWFSPRRPCPTLRRSAARSCPYLSDNAAIAMRPLSTSATSGPRGSARVARLSESSTAMSVPMRSCVGESSSAKTRASMIALCARVRRAAQRAEHHDVARRDEFGSGIHVADDDDRTELLQASARRGACRDGRACPDLRNFERGGDRRAAVPRPWRRRNLGAGTDGSPCARRFAISARAPGEIGVEGFRPFRDLRPAHAFGARERACARSSPPDAGAAACPNTTSLVAPRDVRRVRFAARRHACAARSGTAAMPAEKDVPNSLVRAGAGSSKIATAFEPR